MLVTQHELGGHLLKSLTAGIYDLKKKSEEKGTHKEVIYQAR